MSATITTPETIDYEPQLGSYGLAVAAPHSDFDGSTRTLVIGDIHGHLDRFEALLKQENLLVRCECMDDDRDWNIDVFCPACNGNGWKRIRRDEVEVVLVGDVGHFGIQNPTGDILSWQYATEWADVILWGNHDRAVIDSHHQFRGYLRPQPEVKRYFNFARSADMLKLAHATHGFLITHAGLHADFAEQKVHPRLKFDPDAFADWINEAEDLNRPISLDQHSIRDAIGPIRGGRLEKAGGILWRDIREPLYRGFPQVFGHSANSDHLFIRDEDSWCIDIGGKGERTGDNCLGGLYLPEEKMVRVDL